AVGDSRIEKTNPLGKFTLDESFDCGQDSGSPVIDEYEAKMPFKFTGTLRKVEIKLGDHKLTPKERGERHRLRREPAQATQGRPGGSDEGRHHLQAKVTVEPKK